MNNLQPSLTESPFDRELVSRIHPVGWRNPEPAGRYDLVVIGAGTAGLVAAASVAKLRGRVALIERHFMGGDCLVSGCVPSKSLLRSARFYAEMRDADLYAASGDAPREIDFGAVMERMRRLRAHVGRHDEAARFRDLGVEVYFGEARFTSHDTVDVAGCRLRFRRALIATGSRAKEPAIPGLAPGDYLTNETIFNLTARPRRLAVIGGGPLGCELAQAFSRLGCEVTIVQAATQFLAGEEREAAQLVADALERDGIRVHLNTHIERVEGRGSERVVHVTSAGVPSEIAADAILVAIGRVANVTGLGLDTAGVGSDPKKGVLVDDRLRTSNRRIYAAGDVCLDHKFTHMAEATAVMAVQNALFLGRKKLSSLTVPWCTYTDPEVAHVGMYVSDAACKGIAVTTFTVPMQDIDRAITDGEQEGFVKIHVRAGGDRILGATIVARHAGEMINEISLAMVAGVGLKTLGKVIHSYPTQAEAIRKAADAYNRSRLSPRVLAAASRWLAFWR